MDTIILGIRKPAKAFPFPPELQQMVNIEWGSPETSLRSGRHLGRTYLWSPDDLDRWLRFLKVDALVTAVTKHTTIPV